MELLHILYINTYKLYFLHFIEIIKVNIIIQFIAVINRKNLIIL